MRYSTALFDMFNILVEPTDETEIQIIGRPPQRRLFPFVGSPLLLTNLYKSLADLSIFRRPVEPALKGAIICKIQCEVSNMGIFSYAPPTHIPSTGR